jgi:predicted phage-related endonuclease
VWGLPYCDVPIDTGTDFTVYRVEADAEIFLPLVDIAKRFWDYHIVSDVEPELDPDRDTSSWVSKHWTQGTDKIRDATPDEARLLAQYKDLKKSMKKIVDLEVQIKRIIGSDEGIRIPGTDAVVTHKARKDGRRVLRSAKLMEADDATFDRANTVD